MAVAEDGSARSGLGGPPIPVAEEWKAEHLVLAGLVRCTLASLGYHVRRAGLSVTSSGNAHGVVTQREDGVWGFVEIDAAFAVQLEPPPGADAARELIEKAERGCFVANSLQPRPRYRWSVDGKEIA